MVLVVRFIWAVMLKGLLTLHITTTVQGRVLTAESVTVVGEALFCSGYQLTFGKLDF